MSNIPSQVELEDKPCPISKEKNDDEIVLKGTDRLHGLPGTFTVVKSKSSGLMRTNPRPTPETMGFYYPDDYGPYEGTKVTKKEPSKNNIFKDIKKAVFQFNNEKIPKLAPGKMLEIGCASGGFMHGMALKGWEVEGIEFSEKAARNAQSLGYNVHVGQLETAPTPKKLYDLVVGWMVLEHLHEPVLSLKKLHEWTKDDAWLVLSVPNAASFEFKLFKDYWYALQVPTHLFHYTPKSIERVLLEAQWEVKEIYYQRNLSNFFVSLSLKLEDMGFNNKLITFLKQFPKGRKRHFVLYPIALILAIFGQTGRMTVWATKKSNDQ